MGEAPGQSLQRWKDATPEERLELGKLKRARIEKAWELHISGASYGKIGLELGVSPPQARHYVKIKADEIYKNEMQDTRYMRTKEVARLDVISERLLERIGRNDDDALELYLKLVAHKARLMGLYAPVKVKMEHSSKRIEETTSREAIDRKIFDLYKRLKRRGKEIKGDLEKWVEEHVIDGELIVAQEDTTEEPGVSGGPQSSPP